MGLIEVIRAIIKFKKDNGFSPYHIDIYGLAKALGVPYESIKAELSELREYELIDCSKTLNSWVIIIKEDGSKESLSG